MTNFIETAIDFNNSADNFDWEIPTEVDLAGLKDRSHEQNIALDLIFWVFKNENDVEFGWEARNAWEDIARDFYNTNN